MSTQDNLDKTSGHVERELEMNRHSWCVRSKQQEQHHAGTIQHFISFGCS